MIIIKTTRRDLFTVAYFNSLQRYTANQNRYPDPEFQGDVIEDCENLLKLLDNFEFQKETGIQLLNTNSDTIEILFEGSLTSHIESIKEYQKYLSENEELIPSEILISLISENQ